ncbi:unnamed protein product [Leptosia nina]|uniref:Uncharacterized protein n=1 Tax=Leptosia nina TaxID=320188 RepID=A0AAV1J0A9_9NEOP
MRSALLCVLFTLIIHKGTRGDDFRPTPIPLDEWHPTKRDESAGTLHEVIKTESPPSVAAVPAHYWEDALRHSVYLTLVRDKIDALIAQGDVISPNSKLDQTVSKEVDDHDLWEKIKKAPFERLQSDEVNSMGDVAIMAKGRLLENESGFRFTEDNRTQDNCNNERCAEGVKAFWSVKRVRQRDQETSPGKYHYELTFSVVSQIPKKQKKPYENPIRTFTVRETSPDRKIELPQENRKYDVPQFQAARPHRAIWFHKNIVPIPPHTRRPPYRGLDRIFSSIFSDDDDTSYDQPQPKYRSNSGPYQYSKIGHAGPSFDYHGQKKPIAYPYKQSQPYKYVRPPLQAPPAGPLQHHYLDYDSSPIINGNPYSPHDSRVSPTQTVKTTRPAVLPTPLPITPPQKDQIFDLGSPMLIESAENSENITRFTEMNVVHKNPTKMKPTSLKGHFPEHIRPPVYNAPPGVFVTMDKKPFKPMPPLKLVHNAKPHRVNKPVDFRPSPQVHDSQSPGSDPLFETAFRPITVNYADISTTERIELTHVKKGNNKQRKTTNKKPSKKHQNIKSNRVTTPVPDIITAQSNVEDELEELNWANVLSAFTKTTPMVLPTEKLVPIETTTSFLDNSTTVAATTPKKPKDISEATTESTTTTTYTNRITTSTTLRPKKRTRPPPKFTKQDKFKKHKRITTPPTFDVPDRSIVRKPSTDPPSSASTTARGIYKSFWDAKNNKTHATSSTTTTTSTSTVRPTTTKTVSTTIKQVSTTPLHSTTTFLPRETPTTPKSDVTVSTTSLPRSRNRFRQSTLFYKGTSVKHDKWSFRNNGTSQPEKNYRRTSNFQGYVTSTTPFSSQKVTEPITSSTVATEGTSTTEKTVINKSVEKLENNRILPSDTNNENETENDEEETRDHSEYIFDHSTATNYNSNEVIGLDATTTEIIPPQFDSPKNKTKCKKKRLNATIEVPESSTEQSTPKSTTEDSTDDIFEQLFGFNLNSESSTPKDMSQQELLEVGSSHHASFLRADDDLTDFMAEFNKKHKRPDPSSEEDYEEGDEDDDNNDDDDEDDDDQRSDEESGDDEGDEPSQLEDGEEKESSRDSRYESYDLGRPYSFLELMAME